MRRITIHTHPIQNSVYIWMNMMYTFWVLLIGFAMATLVLIYSYQFDGMEYFWSEYIGIPSAV